MMSGSLNRSWSVPFLRKGAGGCLRLHPEVCYASHERTKIHQREDRGNADVRATVEAEVLSTVMAKEALGLLESGCVKQMRLF